MRRLLFICMFSVGSFLCASSQAFSLCSRDPLDGAFFTTNRATRNLVAMEYQQFCNDTVNIPCDDTGCHPPPPPPAGRVRLQGSCSPITCDWGWVNVKVVNDWRFANLDQGFVKREIWVRYDNAGQFSEVVTRSHYTDGRADREDREYFHKSRMNIEPNTDRGGQDYRNFDLSSPDYTLCYDACVGDSACRAYTYVPPAVQGPKARCWLKNGIPSAKYTAGMVSGYLH